MKIKILLLVVVLAFGLCACSAENGLFNNNDEEKSWSGESDIPIEDDSERKELPEIVLPIDSTIDMSASFSEGVTFFDETREKVGLICENMDTSSFAQANDTVTLSDADSLKLTIHCTWLSAARTVYIGLFDVVTEQAYTISATGGSLSGTLALDDLPQGEYRVILYSSDNENIHAVMLYQFV